MTQIPVDNIKKQAASLGQGMQEASNQYDVNESFRRPSAKHVIENLIKTKHQEIEYLNTLLGMLPTIMTPQQEYAMYHLINKTK